MHSLGAASANQACIHPYLSFSSVHRMTAYNSKCTAKHLTLFLLQWLYLCHLSSSCLPFQFPVSHKITCDVSVSLSRRQDLNADVPWFASLFLFLILSLLFFVKTEGVTPSGSLGETEEKEIQKEADP